MKYTKRKVCLYCICLSNGTKTLELKEISRFANGLEKDIEAVENSVASELSNGFVEGTNSKLKMVKRTMYCELPEKLTLVCS